MNLCVPIDPPAEMEQYSNSPSNTGQSSPTLSGGAQKDELGKLWSFEWLLHDVHVHFDCSRVNMFMFSGEILARNSTYSSEWNWDISRFVAGLARCKMPGGENVSEDIVREMPERNV
jgi:hypothetical protein